MIPLNPWDFVPVPKEIKSNFGASPIQGTTCSLEDFTNAQALLLKYKLHIYQLLYSQRLTCPPSGACQGHPWAIEFTPHLFLKISRKYEGRTIELVGTNPEDLYKKAIFIEDALKGKPSYCSSRACCPLASRTECVCIESLTCPIHGPKCYGSHD